jgi:phosphatidylglycerol:prolipoprotein diacylglycerol transferase
VTEQVSPGFLPRRNSVGRSCFLFASKLTWPRMDKIALKVGSITIYWYGILVAAGFLAAIWTAARRGKKIGVDPAIIYDHGPWLLLGSIVGARILHVISYWEKEFAGKPIWEIFMVQNGGLVFYGGFIGACLTTIIYSRVKKIPLWRLADVLTPSISLGHAFGRVGCFMTGCCYGKTCALPWAVRYPASHETRGEPVHPTQLYEAGLNLGLYFFLAWLFGRRKFDGQVFAAYLICYAGLRSIVEVYRSDYAPSELFFGTLTPAHMISAGLIVAGVVLFAVLPKLKNSAPRA